MWKVEVVRSNDTAWEVLLCWLTLHTNHCWFLATRKRQSSCKEVEKKKWALSFRFGFKDSVTYCYVKAVVIFGCRLLKYLQSSFSPFLLTASFLTTGLLLSATFLESSGSILLILRVLLVNPSLSFIYRGQINLFLISLQQRMFESFWRTCLK